MTDSLDIISDIVSPMETRNNIAPELRVDGSQEETRGRTLYGKAVVYNSRSEWMVDNKTNRRFQEVFLPGAFKSTLANDRAEIKADVGHAQESIIGKRSTGTLKLQDSAEALSVEVDLPNSATSLAESIERQDVDGMSIAFRVNPGGERWRKLENGWLREITDADLLRVTVTAEPAYVDTSVAVRSLIAQEKDEETETQEKDEKISNEKEGSNNEDTEQDNNARPLQYYEAVLKQLDAESE